MKNHLVKIFPEYFHDVTHNLKKFEIRKNDRKYGVGDCLYLQECNTEGGGFTGGMFPCRIDYILDEGPGLKPGYVILGISPWNEYINWVGGRALRYQLVDVPYLGPSLNKIYAGVHWRERQKMANDAHLSVLAAIKGQKTKKVDYRVDLEFSPYLGPSQKEYDTSNYSFTNKMIEDGLVKSGILVDDSTNWVRRIISNPPCFVKSGTIYKPPFVRVKIKEVGKCQ